MRSTPGFGQDLWNTLNHSIRTHNRHSTEPNKGIFIEQLIIYHTLNYLKNDKKEKNIILLWYVTINSPFPFTQLKHLQISFYTNKDMVHMSLNHILIQMTFSQALAGNSFIACPSRLFMHLVRLTLNCISILKRIHLLNIYCVLD